MTLTWLMSDGDRPALHSASFTALLCPVWSGPGRGYVMGIVAQPDAGEPGVHPGAARRRAPRPFQYHQAGTLAECEAVAIDDERRDASCGAKVFVLIDLARPKPAITSGVGAAGRAGQVVATSPPPAPVTSDRSRY
jgi:hypothetical protein